MNDIYESIEWVNYWVENNQTKKRILVVGDSVARQFRKALNKLLKDQFAVDLIATSCYPGLEKCLKIVDDFFMNDLEYEYIIVNLGAHHGYYYSTYSNKEAERVFNQRLSRIFQVLANRCIKLFVLAGTPESFQYVENNLEIRHRNEIIRNICLEKQYPFIDVCEEMIEKNFEYKDGWCHFREDGDYFIARNLYTIMLGETLEIDIIVSIYELKKFIYSINKVYIYGNGKRGKALKQYLEIIKKDFCVGVIVSPDYFNDNEDVLTLKMVEKDANIIVTPMEVNIIRHLTEQKYTYFFLADKLYEYMYMYNEIFKDR